MKYAILGASGFIGRHLCEYLTTTGHEVRLIPRDMYGNYYTLKKYLTAENPDYIINCAAYGNHANQEVVENLDELYFSNVISPLKLLTATKDIPYKGLVLMGSSSEYGRQTEPMDELTTPLETDTFYGATKVAQTYLARAFARQLNKPVLVVRPFSVYGPGEASFRFIPTVIRSIMTGEPMSLDPIPKHDWIYVEDFVRIMVKIASNPDAYPCEVVNIGTGIDHSNIEVAQLLEEISGGSVSIKSIAGKMRSFDTATSWKASPSLMRKLHQPHTNLTSLEDGLRKTYEYYQDIH